MNDILFFLWISGPSSYWNILKHYLYTNLFCSIMGHILVSMDEATILQSLMLP